MSKPELEPIEKGRQPPWQRWALLMVVLGCVATLAATLYDIA